MELKESFIKSKGAVSGPFDDCSAARWTPVTVASPAAHEECVVLSQCAEGRVRGQESVTGLLGAQEAEQVEAFTEL